LFAAKVKGAFMHKGELFMQQLNVRHFALGATVFALSIIAGAQTQSAAPSASTPKWSYDAVSIKPNKSDSYNTRMMFQGNNVSAENARILDIVAQAYDIRAELISGMPGWTNNAHYDIAAKMAPDDAVAFTKLNRDDRRAANQTMMQAMLADRFKLKAHIETKELPVHELVLAKGAPKLKPVAYSPDDPNTPKGPDGIARPGGMIRMGLDSLSGQGVQMVTLVNVLANQVHRKVIDKTGLTGHYDFSLKFAMDRDNFPALPPGFNLPPPSSDDPTIFAALEEQLGLKLVPGKGSVDTLVIDHIEQPTEN
jgi:uncharacterized protein (TIGR03435 family)